MAKFLRPSGRVTNFLRFITSGNRKYSGSDSTDPCGNKPDKLPNCSDPCDKHLRTPKLPKSLLSDPCPRVCPPPRLPPRESCECDEPEELFPVTEEDKARVKFWEMITYFGAIPLVILAISIILPASLEHQKKPRPEYIPYSYMHRITKPFFWGDGKHSLFHNPRLNPIPPDGYEIPDPYALEKKD